MSFSGLTTHTHLHTCAHTSHLYVIHNTKKENKKEMTHEIIIVSECQAIETCNNVDQASN